MKPLTIREKCHDCGVGIGQNHEPGCDTEVCPECGGQMISCNCSYKYLDIDVATMEEEHPDIYHNGLPDDMAEKYEQYIQPHLIPWDGVWPGVKECREYGLWNKWVDEKGWVECNADDPDATEDLNKLAMLSQWNKEKKHYEVTIYNRKSQPEAQSKKQGVNRFLLCLVVI